MLSKVMQEVPMMGLKKYADAAQLSIGAQTKLIHMA
jgi:hypothetical protein